MPCFPLRTCVVARPQLLYGGWAVSQGGAAFAHETPAAAFVDVSFSNNFFKSKACFRWNQSTCIPDPSLNVAGRNTDLDQYYEVGGRGCALQPCSTSHAEKDPCASVCRREGDGGCARLGLLLSRLWVCGERVQ